MDVTQAAMVLVDHAASCGIIEQGDRRWALNMVLAALHADGCTDEPLSPASDADLDSALDSLTTALRALPGNEMIVDRDDAACLLLGPVMPRPSQVSQRFAQLAVDDPCAATDWLYALSCDTRYVRRAARARNICWTSPTRWGELEITINLSKPEKDPRKIAADASARARGSYPACQLCRENEGYAGRGDADPHGPHPARQNLRIADIELGGERWGLQYSPYAYYDEHCILMSDEHRPMRVDAACLARLLDAVDLLPHYFVGSNADLPIVGGSILSHDHFQGGRHTFPMDRAPIDERFELAGFDDVEAGWLRWPVSVVRLSCKDRRELLGAACAVMDAWRAHDDAGAGIVSHTGDVPHNTVTPIARRRDGRHELDLALRCNVTSTERPLGIFHPRPELHHIKRENIGLIEVMGLAILPPRLKRGLDAIRDCLLTGTDLASAPEVLPHLDWAVEVAAAHRDMGSDAVEQILRDEVAQAFAHVLEDAGVFKWTDEGRVARDRFTDVLVAR